MILKSLHFYDFFSRRQKRKQAKPSRVNRFLVVFLCGIQFLFVLNIQGQNDATINGTVTEPEWMLLSKMKVKEENPVKVYIKRNKYLLVNRSIIEKIENAELEVGSVNKHPQNPLLVEDKPWEKRFDNFYGNVTYDEEEGLFKWWYSPFIVDHSSQGMSFEQRKVEYKPPPGREMGICYAISKDGIIWEKPNLGIVEFEGSMENNIMLRGPHGAGIFKDVHDPNPYRKYKTIFQGLFVSFSENGINWSQKNRIKSIKVAGDTHNNAFWAPTLEKYVGITRTFGDLRRQVTRIESDDFINWSNEEVVLKGENKNLQPYSMPVFFYGGVYLGLVTIHDQETDRVWTELAWSPDTRKWVRISPGTPLIPVSESKLDYDYGCVYACANPIFLDDEIRLYYGGSDWLHFGWRNGSFNLATLRPDGFAGYIQKSADKKAVVTTTHIEYSGETIRINADVEKGARLKLVF